VKKCGMDLSWENLLHNFSSIYVFHRCHCRPGDDPKKHPMSDEGRGRETEGGVEFLDWQAVRFDQINPDLRSMG